jgi:hypothetical protein
MWVVRRVIKVQGHILYVVSFRAMRTFPSIYLSTLWSLNVGGCTVWCVYISIDICMWAWGGKGHLRSHRRVRVPCTRCRILLWLVIFFSIYLLYDIMMWVAARCGTSMWACCGLWQLTVSMRCGWGIGGHDDGCGSHVSLSHLAATCDFFCLSTYSMTSGCGWLHGVAPNVSVVLFFAIHGEYDPGKRWWAQLHGRGPP